LTFAFRDVILIVEVTVMGSCPNRKRRKRIHKGGGDLACPGKLQVVLLVPITVKMVRSAKHSLDWERVVSATVKRRGLRIKPAQLEAAFQRGADIACDSCGWSFRRIVNGIKAESARLHRARR
jgi:hypothetical protein